MRALGRDTDALGAALPVATGPPEITNETRREAYVEAGLAALALGDETAVTQLIQFVADMPPAARSPLLRAGAARFTGLLAARRGDTNTADEQLTEATSELREIDAPFVLAQVLLEHAELHHADGRDARRRTAARRSHRDLHPAPRNPLPRPSRKAPPADFPNAMKGTARLSPWRQVL